MKPKKGVLTILVFFLGIGLFMWAGDDKRQKKEPDVRKVKSLIKKELLPGEKRELGPSRRNIFSPRNSRIREEAEDVSGFPLNREEVLALFKRGASSFNMNNNSSGAGLDIRYIGYVISEEKVIALIIFNGNALAVSKGEMIGIDEKVGDITPEDIEIISQDSEKRKYSLEGEKE